MAEKSIDTLTQATSVGLGDLMVLQQSGEAKSLPATVLKDWVETQARGYGGIESVELSKDSSGNDVLILKWTNRTKPNTTITFSSPSIYTFDVEYQAGDSGTSEPTGSWKDTIAEANVKPGQYLWQRTTLRYNTGNVVQYNLVSYYGRNGDGSGTVTSVNGVTPDDTGALSIVVENKHRFITRTISGGFISSGPNDDYPYTLNITESNVTSNTHARLIFELSVVGLTAPICETYNGGIHAYFSEIPASPFTVQAELWEG